MQEIKKYILSIVTFVMIVTGACFEISAQTRQRKTPQKTTVQTKKTTTTGSKPKTSSEAKRKKAAVEKEIQLTESQIKENNAKVSRELNALGKINNEIDITTANIRQLNSKLNRLNNEIKGLEENIEKNEKDLTVLRDEYLKAVKKMRSTRRNKSELAFIFSSKTINQAMRRMRYLKEFSSWKTRQTDEINAKIADLKNEKEALAKAKTEQEISLRLQKSNKEKLALQQQQQEFLVGELRKNGKALEGILQKKQTEARELDAMVSQLIAEEQRRAAEEARRKTEEEKRRQEAEAMAKKNTESDRQLAQSQNNKKDKDKKTSEKNKQKKSTDYADARKRTPRSGITVGRKEQAPETEDFLGMKGKLPYPTTGSFSVTSRFGRQHMPDMPDVEYDNPGVDAETEAGSSAKAVYKGKVAGVYLLPGYHTVVILNHGNYYTVYGNLAASSVKTGDTIEAGTSLGKLVTDEDNPGTSSIHFEVWRNREKLNPLEWLR